MTQSRERKVAEFIENIEKIYQMPEKEQQQALEEKRGELLEDIFPISPITPADTPSQKKQMNYPLTIFTSHPMFHLAQTIAKIAY